MTKNVKSCVYFLLHQGKTFEWQKSDEGECLCKYNIKCSEYLGAARKLYLFCDLKNPLAAALYLQHKTFFKKIFKKYCIFRSYVI